MDPREHRQALWFLPTFIHSLNKMSAEVLIAAVTGHPVLYEPTLFQFRDRNAIVVWIPSYDKREYLYI